MWNVGNVGNVELQILIKAKVSWHSQQWAKTSRWTGEFAPPETCLTKSECHYAFDKISSILQNAAVALWYFFNRYNWTDKDRGNAESQLRSNLVKNHGDKGTDISQNVLSMFNLDAAGKKTIDGQNLVWKIRMYAYIFLHVELALDCVSEKGVRVSFSHF